VEPPKISPGPVRVHQRGDRRIVLADRMAKRAAGKPAQNPPGAGTFVTRVGRTAHKHFSPAGRVTRPGRIERTRDGEVLYAGAARQLGKQIVDASRVRLPD